MLAGWLEFLMCVFALSIGSDDKQNQSHHVSLFSRERMRRLCFDKATDVAPLDGQVALREDRRAQVGGDGGERRVEELLHYDRPGWGA